MNFHYIARNGGTAKMKAVLLASVATVILSGCTTMYPKTGDAPVKPLVGPVVTRAETPMNAALTCLADHMPDDLDLRIGVADVSDGTGATADGDSLSRVLTQRPDLMLVVALSKTGVRLVNRSSTSVAEWEMKQALEKRLGDGKKARIGDKRVDFRPVRVGGLLGSTHYVVGALTEVNWNVDSAVAEAGFYGFDAGTRGYYISIGFDLLVTNTKTTEISMARAYSKQIFGRETKAGFYRFFDLGGSSPNFGPFELFRANVGQKKNEPVQTAVRWVMETAAYDLVRQLSGGGEACDDLLPGAAAIYQKEEPAAMDGGAEQPAAKDAAKPQPEQPAPKAPADQPPASSEETPEQPEAAPAPADQPPASEPERAKPAEEPENIEPPPGSRTPNVPPLETPRDDTIWPRWLLPGKADKSAVPADADGGSSEQAAADDAAAGNGGDAKLAELSEPATAEPAAAEPTAAEPTAAEPASAAAVATEPEAASAPEPAASAANAAFEEHPGRETELAELPKTAPSPGSEAGADAPGGAAADAEPKPVIAQLAVGEVDARVDRPSEPKW